MPRWLDFQKSSVRPQARFHRSDICQAETCMFSCQLIHSAPSSQLRGLLPSKSRLWDRDKGQARSGGKGQGRNKPHFCGTELVGVCRQGQQLFLKNGTMDFMWCLTDSSVQRGKEVEDLRSNSTEVPRSQAFGIPRACQVGGCTARLWKPHSGSVAARSSYKIIAKKSSVLLSVTLSWFLKYDFLFLKFKSGQHSCIWWHAHGVECFYLNAGLRKSSSKTESGCFPYWRI